MEVSILKRAGKLKKIFRFIFSLCLIASMCVLGGCFSVPLPGPFEGRVSDNQSGKPIARAEVVAESWCHDNPLPDGPGNFFVSSNTKTDKNGFFRLVKETRRGGLFGCSFALKISAESYIQTNLLYEPKEYALPPSTVAYPFINTSALKVFPAQLEIQLAPAIPVFLKAIKSGNPSYQRTAREKLTKIIGIDYGYNSDKWEKAIALKESGSAEQPIPVAKSERLDCACPESVDKYSQSRDVRQKAVSLLRAAAWGDVKEVQEILQGGVECNARNNTCRTALMEAASSGHLALVEFLLSKGADANARDKQCKTALMAAASFYNSKAIIKTLLSHGADVNAIDKDGMTALMMASMLKYKDTVAILLAGGAHVNLKDRDGETALFKASVIQSDYDEVITLLKAYGAKN